MRIEIKNIDRQTLANLLHHFKPSIWFCYRFYLTLELRPQTKIIS